MIIDCHSHFGEDYYCGKIELNTYIKYCEDTGINIGFLMPSPWPKYINEDGKEVTALIWDHYNYCNKKYYSIVDNNKIPIITNPYKQVNFQYHILLEKTKSNIQLEYIPLIHGVLDDPNYLHDLFSKIKPKAVKIHGFASGFSPEEIKPDICEVIRYFDLPIIIHTSVYNYDYGYGYSTKYWRNECHPMRWISFLKNNKLKGVLNHGACLNDEAIFEVNRNDDFMIGIGPDLDISRDFFKVDVEKLLYYKIGYLELLKQKVSFNKLLFDIDYNWNTDGNSLDYLQIYRLSQLWNDSELDAILSNNAIKYYKLTRNKNV